MFEIRAVNVLPYSSNNSTVSLSSLRCTVAYAAVPIFRANFAKSGVDIFFSALFVANAAIWYTPGIIDEPGKVAASVPTFSGIALLAPMDSSISPLSAIPPIISICC